MQFSSSLPGQNQWQTAGVIEDVEVVQAIEETATVCLVYLDDLDILDHLCP
jgi:hypothetical protein